jgi:hypothetical protein
VMGPGRTWRGWHIATTVGTLSDSCRDGWERGICAAVLGGVGLPRRGRWDGTASKPVIRQSRRSRKPYPVRGSSAARIARSKRTGLIVLDNPQRAYLDEAMKDEVVSPGSAAVISRRIRDRSRGQRRTRVHPQSGSSQAGAGYERNPALLVGEFS